HQPESSSAGPWLSPQGGSHASRICVASGFSRPSTVLGTALSLPKGRKAVPGVRGSKDFPQGQGPDSRTLSVQQSTDLHQARVVARGAYRGPGLLDRSDLLETH